VPKIKLLFHLGQIGSLVYKRWTSSRLRIVARKFQYGVCVFTGWLDIL